ncbi:uncharacterized protein LOC143922061 [Arctopsyche grandis]|uniref:uncharacterized protein LOC143922061 n=1 Tax=Arctopsyche grandis TaxID=121162 RepID=UPI00406D92A2
MLLSLITLIFAEPSCTPLSDGIVLSKYYLESCAACKRLNPILEEIKSQATKENINIKFREVECTGCECEGITNFPTLEITQDKESKAKAIGYKDYNNLSKWIREALSLDQKIFTNHIDHTEGVVKQLIARDFLTGFDGQWLILFYDDSNDMRRGIFKELSKMFAGKLNIAEVSKNESHNVTSRYNIEEYPLIMAINQGTPVSYSGTVDLGNLAQFVEKLYTPAFQEITYLELKAKASSFINGEPMYVVLYKDFEVASHYFNELAQQFKFKAQIFRSSDPAMFAAAGHQPKDTSDFPNNPDHNQMVMFTLFKNSSFFLSPEKVDQTQEIISWIFHTHFSHVTNITNENFYTVFHGIKPVILLLTQSDMLVDSFNKVSAGWNLGTASSNLIFATLDSIEYPIFKKKILNGVKEPALLFYDPVKRSRYKKEIKKTIREYGVGTCGPRGFYGTVDIHLELETKLAEIFEKEAAILYSNYFTCVQSVIPSFYKLVELKTRFGFRIILDESYTIPFMYQAPENKELYKSIDLIIGSLSHGYPTNGGFCVGCKEAIEFQRLSGSGYVFSASLPAYLMNIDKKLLKLRQEGYVVGKNGEYLRICINENTADEDLKNIGEILRTSE